jgi:hypothetical protein
MKLTKEQLARLTKDEKLQLLDALNEKQRREREKRPPYKPHAGQLAVHKSPAILRLVTSGNGFGKTALICQEAKWRADGYNPVTGEHTPVPAAIAVVLDKPDKADKVFLEEFRKWFSLRPDQLHKRGKPNTTEITFDNGSTITFYTHDQDPLTWESIQIDMAIFDEPPPRESYIGLRRAGRKKGVVAKYLIAGTPLGQAWIKEEIWDPWERGEATDIECFRGNTEQNRSNLAKDYIEKFSAALSDAEKKIRLSGEWFNSGGLALAHLFRRDTHLIKRAELEWDDNNPTVIAIDPHPSKAHHAILLGADRHGQLVALKELKLKLIPRDFARELRKWMKGYRILDIVVDSLGSSEYTGGEGFKSFIQVLNEEGVRARATTYDDKSDEDFIARIQDVLKVPETPDNFGRCLPKLLVSTDCPDLIRDIENVQWVRGKGLDEFKPKLDISHKDMLACLKYALACNLHYTKKKSQAFYYTAPVYGLDVRPARARAHAKIKFGRG